MTYQQIDATIERLRATNQLIDAAFANAWWPLGAPGPTGRTSDLLD